MNCLQKVRDVPVICGILGLLQYPSFARANTVSESHYARTMSSGVRFHYRTLCKYLQIVRESCDCLRYTGIVIVSEFCKSNHSFRFLTIHIHYVRRAFEGIENYYHSYGSLPYQSEYSFQNCALFLSSFTAAGEFRYKLSHTDSGGGAYAYCSRPQHFPQHTDFRIPALYLRRQPIT